MSTETEASRTAMNVLIVPSNHQISIPVATLQRFNNSTLDGGALRLGAGCDFAGTQLEHFRPHFLARLEFDH